MNTEKLTLIIKKHAGSELRRIGLPDVSAFEAHTLNWSDLNARQRDLRKLARQLTDKVKDDTPPEECREIEQVHDILLGLIDQIDGEKDKRSEIGDRGPRKHGGDNRRPVYDDGEVRGGISDDEDESEEVSTFLRREQRMVHWARDNGHDSRGLSLGRYLRAMVVGAQSDAERRALAEGADSAGGYTVPHALSATLIDLMRARTVAVQAGALTVPLTSDKNSIAKLASDPVPAWRAESAQVVESEPTFANITLEPKSLAVLVKVSRELLQDSLNIETALPEVLAAAMAVELDRVCLFGAGSGNEPRGVVNFSGISSVLFNAVLGTTGYRPMIKARTQIKTANFPEVSAYIMHPRDEGTLVEMTDSNGQPLMMPRAIESIPQLTTTAVPTDGGTGDNESTIVAGEFSRLLIGIRSDVRIEILRERYADFLQYGFLCHMRADTAITHPGAFSKITGVQPPAA